MGKIHVLAVFAALDRGGAETMFMNLYREIDKEKIRFDIVKHTAKKCDYDDEIEANGGTIYVAPAYKIYNHFQYVKWWKDFFAEHEEYQIVHGHYFTISAVYLAVARKCGRMAIAHSHSTSINSYIKRLYLKGIEMNSDFRFACSEGAGKWLYPHRDFTIINNAIDVDVYTYNPELRSRVRADFGIDDQLTIGIVGRFDLAKNPVGTMQILEEAFRRNDNVRVLWVGDGAYKRDEVTARIAELGLEDKISLLGTRNDVPQLMQAFDVFMMPSIYEGLPLVLIEAQAAGLPCLCSDVITTDVDITGLCSFIPLGDIDKWCQHLLAVSPAERKNTKDEIVAAGYDIKVTSRYLEDFYLSIQEG